MLVTLHLGMMELINLLIFLQSRVRCKAVLILSLAAYLLTGASLFLLAVAVIGLMLAFQHEILTAVFALADGQTLF